MSKRSKQKGIPPRVLNKYSKYGFYDTPTKLKNSSDNRNGDLPLVYNESTSLSEDRFDTTPIIQGNQIILPSDGEFQQIVRQQEYDNGGLPVESPNLSFKDSQQYALDYFQETNSAAYKLLVSGSKKTVGNGYKQPVWSKSKFEVNLPSQMENTVVFSISQSDPLWNFLPALTSMLSAGGISLREFYSETYISASISGSTATIFNHLTGALNESYPMLYYNFDNATWEGIGKGWTLCSSFLPSAAGEADPTISPGFIGSHEHATIGFSPSILNYFEGKQKYITGQQVALLSTSFFGEGNSFTSSLVYLNRRETALTASMKNFSCTTWEEMMAAGQPIDDFGFPFAAKYHATGSQTLKLKDYITKPFAVERIAVAFDNVEYTVFDTAYNMLEETDTENPIYGNWITSSIAPGAINNFFILNQRKNQKLDTKLLLASIYSSLYEGIHQALYKGLDGWIRNTWEINFYGYTGGLSTIFDGDFNRATSEFADVFAQVVINTIQYYFAKLPLQLTLPQDISLTFEDLLANETEHVDTIRELITWGGVTSYTTEATKSYPREFATLYESLTYNDIGRSELGSLLGAIDPTEAALTAAISGGMPSPWMRTLPLYKFLIDTVKKKKSGDPNIFTIDDVARKLSEFIPGLTSKQAYFLADSFGTTNNAILQDLNLKLPKWWMQGAELEAWKNDYDSLFANSPWEVPLTQTAIPLSALERECNVETGGSLENNRLPGLSFSQSIQMVLPCKNPTSTRFTDFDTYLWQPTNPADIHPVFCTSTHASFELGGRNGLGAIHATDREPESGYAAANVILNDKLDFAGTMFANVCDGEIEEHALYSMGGLALRNFTVPTFTGSDVGFYRSIPIILYGYLGFSTPYGVTSHGQYFASTRKLYDVTTESIKEYKNAFYTDTPYILFPSDELIFGWQQPIPRDVAFSNWVSQSYFPQNWTSPTPQPGVIPISEIKMGNAKVIFYGSELSEGKEIHDTLNQYLTNGRVFEVIG